MIYDTTEIDTISLQLNFGNDDNKQRLVQMEILDYIRKTFNSFIDPVKYYAGFDERIEYKLYCNNRTVVSFKTGYSHNNYFITIKFAGLKTYDVLVDETSSNYLWVIVAYINTNRYGWSFAELDLAIDVPYINFENLQAICTAHTSGTKYHTLGVPQIYHGETTWVELFETDTARNTAIKRAYLYNKTIKELAVHGNVLGFNLQRFEIKLQTGYFNKSNLDIETIANTLDMYHLLYFENVVDKNALVDRYNRYKSVRKRELDRMGFEEHRLYPNIEYVHNFLYMLTEIESGDIFVNPPLE